jgi:hypothetical protein
MGMNRARPNAVQPVFTLAVLLSCLFAAGCDNPADQSASSSLLCVLDTRAVSALGYTADSCLYRAVSGGDTLYLSPPVFSEYTEALLSGVPEGNTELLFALFGSDSVLAEGSVQGWSGADDTTLVDIRVRFESSLDRFLLESSWGGADAPTPPCSILFVGNSYTFANGGLDSIFTGLVLSADPVAELYCETIAFGGYTLQNHYESPFTMGAISRGGWDLVVMQEQSTRPVTDPELMYLYAGLLGQAIRNSGGSPGFFMTWARKNDPPMIVPLSHAYFHAGALTDGMVAPVGLAWERVRVAHPDMELYDADGSHPNLRGTYLAACTMYAAAMGESPVGILYSNDPEMTESERLILQEAAWSAVQDNGPPDWRHF